MCSSFPCGAVLPGVARGRGCARRAWPPGRRNAALHPGVPARPWHELYFGFQSGSASGAEPTGHGHSAGSTAANQACPPHMRAFLPAAACAGGGHWRPAAALQVPEHHAIHVPHALIDGAGAEQGRRAGGHSALGGGRGRAAAGGTGGRAAAGAFSPNSQHSASAGLLLPLQCAPTARSAWPAQLHPRFFLLNCSWALPDQVHLRFP